MNKDALGESPAASGPYSSGSGSILSGLKDWTLWIRLHPLRWIPIFVGLSWLLAVWIQIILKPRGDFPHHWELGRRLAEGIYIYFDDLDFVYPPFWALAHAPLSVFGLHPAQILAYPAAFLSITALVWTLYRLTCRHLPLQRNALFWSNVLAVFLASQFLGRDLPEIGVNTMLVALTWLAVYFWSERREALAGTLLGLAAALKCTPLLFVGWFALKREWRMVFFSAGALAVFTISPVLVTGPAQYVRMMDHWVHGVVQGLRDLDPSRGPLGEEKVENLSLRPALARYLMHLPYGHMGRPETSDSPDRPNSPPNPFYRQFLDLSPLSAGIAVRAIMGGLMIWLIWFLRHRIPDRKSLEVAWECAALSITILLVSPITWVQHAVGTLPALYLVCSARFAGWPFPGWAAPAMGVYALFCVALNRSLFDRDFIKLANSYRLKTIGFILLLCIVLACLREARNRSLGRESARNGVAGGGDS